MKLNERIKTCRQRSGLTQEQVAEALDVSRQAVTKWEKGTSAPSTENLFKLAELFGTTVDMILSDTAKDEEESEPFVFLRDKNFWIAVIFGLSLFLVICPYGYDMYIPVVFTLLCICLNGYSVLFFSIFLHKHLTRKEIGEDFGMYIGVLIFGVLGHAVFCVMNWGSWVCLALSVICYIWLIVKKRAEDTIKNEKST